MFVSFATGVASIRITYEPGSSPDVSQAKGRLAKAPAARWSTKMVPTRIEPAKAETLNDSGRVPWFWTMAMIPTTLPTSDKGGLAEAEVIATSWTAGGTFQRTAWYGPWDDKLPVPTTWPMLLTSEAEPPKPKSARTFILPLSQRKAWA